MKHPLLGRFDLDPGRWRPMYYGVEIGVPVALDGMAQGSITLNNQPFVLTKITHAIVGCTAVPDTTGLYQDGQYTIEFRDEQSNYQNMPIQADALLGSVRVGQFQDLPYPIPFAGNRTLTFRIVNRCLRVLDPVSETFQVAVVLHGVADWGELQSRADEPCQVQAP